MHEPKPSLRSTARDINELAELLIKREVIFAEDVERIFGKASMGKPFGGNHRGQHAETGGYVGRGASGTG